MWGVGRVFNTDAQTARTLIPTTLLATMGPEPGWAPLSGIYDINAAQSGEVSAQRLHTLSPTLGPGPPAPLFPAHLSTLSTRKRHNWPRLEGPKDRPTDRLGAGRQGGLGAAVSGCVTLLSASGLTGLREPLIPHHLSGLPASKAGGPWPLAMDLSIFPVDKGHPKGRVP